MRPLVSMCLLATLLVSACTSSDSPEAEQSLLRFLPEEASGLVFVDLTGLRQNPFASRFMNEYVGIQVPERLDDFTAITGFDPETSVRQVMGVSTGDGSEGLMVVGASYDHARVTRYLSDEGMLYAEHGDVALFRPDTEREVVAAFVDDVILVGGEAEVRRAIDRARGELRSALNNPELLEQIRTIGDGYQVWATGRIDAGLIPDELGGAGPAALLQTVERGTYQMSVDDVVTVRAVGEFADSRQASDFAGLLEGLRGMAMVAGIAGDFGELLSGVLISNDESIVAIEFEVETALLERLAASRMPAR